MTCLSTKTGGGEKKTGGGGIPRGPMFLSAQDTSVVGQGRTAMFHHWWLR